MSERISIDEQIKVLSRRCERILNEQDLGAKLERSAKTGKPLRIKMGMDPTAPDVTLGHAVPQLRAHIAAAHKLGASRQQIVEVILQMTFYAGGAATSNALRVAKEVLASI